ncbi:bifunctional 2-polyprenyl-6-hydroxyphenol methylase/3-demethylubiquinol 3-O-methyltransferase UbiG [Caulobacter sp. S45]|uniref:class I SAM-dependent methyltransferase n=1 Tax=Caulobacter sp. S45 TaxID=1641861 RepID=UPI00131C0A51|nr:class I SAM-dependent methyltransferase [Caulobacter sp. S45]
MSNRLPDTVRRMRGMARYALLRLSGDDRTHYTRDYRRLVQSLIAQYPLDEAMSRAVGGLYAEMGQLQTQVLIDAGLADGDRLLDLGCGSGRLANTLKDRVAVEYLGLDIIPELLAYARTRAPPSYRFVLNTKLTLPVTDERFDMACAFSVFTHLQHEETFLYLSELARVIRPGGRLVFSFLEFRAPEHWLVFRNAVHAVSESRRVHLDMFIERSVIDLWCSQLGFEREQFVGPGDAGVGGSLGQSVAILRRT